MYRISSVGRKIFQFFHKSPPDKGKTGERLTNMKKSFEEIKTFADVIMLIPARLKTSFLSFAKGIAQDENTQDEHYASELILNHAESVLRTCSKTSFLFESAEYDDIRCIAINNLASVGFCAFHVERSIIENRSVMDYLHDYLLFKFESFRVFNDFGYFGDIVETVTHLLVCEKLWRVKRENLHVSAIGKVDLKYKGEKFEIGTNGKSFLESTQSDFMSGKYTSLVYGMFDDMDKETIRQFIMENNTRKAVKTIASMLYVFENKYDFPVFMESISRGKTLAWKGQYMQVVFNPSKYNAFCKAIEETDFPTLADYMLEKNPDNEFLK